MSKLSVMAPKRASVASRAESGSFPIAASALWILGVALWLFVVASLLGFSAGDPPTHTVWPANSPVRNWCGLVGAAVSYWAFLVFGAGVWVMALASGLWLSLGVFGRSASYVPLRAVGVVMLALALGSFQALLFPSSGAFPDLAGGLAGGTIASRLSGSFGLLGAVLWVICGGIVGALVAFDRWVVLAPLWTWRRTAPVMARAGSAVASRGPGILGRVGSVLGGRPGRRENDLDDDESIPTARLAGGGRGDASGPATTVRKRTGRDAVGRVFKASDTQSEHDQPAPESATAPGEADEETDEDLGLGFASAEGEAESDEHDAEPYDADFLREKISKLPIVFGARNVKVATDDDMRDLQGVDVSTNYAFPPIDLLEDPEENFNEKLEQIVREQATALEQALHEYRIKGEVVGIESGPVVTLYDVRLAPGTKVSVLSAVASDIARSLRAINVRIVPNQAGRDTVGIEVPNPTKEKVRLKELMSSSTVVDKMRLPMFLGKDASGEPLILDLTKLPHMLIAGTTGSGKSVCINTIITGFLYTKRPNELRLVLVDPKMVEMSQFKDIPHLMCPVVTEMSRAAAILEWAVTKMDERYELLAEAGCRDIAAYNELPWDELRERLHVETPEEEAKIPRSLPYMVFVIDELADLMMTNKEVEGSIIRIAQKARAVGIHLILATQRPQANVVTGLIKSNMPCRVCFKVASGMDSRIVMDHKGGELLLGMGDMLVLTPSTHKIARAQGTLVDDAEIRKVVRFLRDNAGQQFERSLLSIRTGDPDEDRLLASENNSSASLAAAQEDPLFERAVEIVLETKRGSVSLLQRRLAIGYTRASRLIDLMGIAGIIGEHKGSVARDVAITPEMWDAMKRQAAADAEAAGEPSLFSASPAPAQPPAPASVPAPLTDIDDAPPFDADNEAAIEVHAVDRDLTFVADGDDDADYGHDEFDEPDDTR